MGPDHASAFNDKGGDGGSSGGGSSGGGSTGSDKTTGGSSGGGSSGGGSGKMTAYKIGSSAFSTTIASYNNQLMMFIYATAPVSSIEILGSDGAFYPAVYSFPSQTGWQQIVSVPIQSTWCSKSNVTIRVDGSSQGQVPLDDKQGCK